MSRLKNLEHQVKELSADELATFRRWCAAFDAEVCDQEFEADAAVGKLDRAAAQALRDHTAGRSTPL